MYQDKFAVGEGIYLLNHSVGRPPLTSQAIVEQCYFEPWARADAEPWPQWLAEIDRFRDALASIFGGERANFCPQPNLSSALTKVVNSQSAEQGRDTIVYCEADFPSMGFVLSMAKKAGYKLRCIPDSAELGDAGAWSKFIDDGCRMILITHVHSNSSRLVPVTGICDVARQQGVISMVDVAQSAGIVPIDLHRWDADFVLGSCVKFLCGGPGAGFLWVNDRALQQSEPTDVGWFSHADPFEFDIHNFRYADNALRFWGGTPAVLPYVVAANSIELLDEIGIEETRTYSLYLTQKILDSIDNRVVVTPLSPCARGGSLVLDFGKHQPVVEERLATAGVHFDARHAGIRLSPHIYTTKEEIGRVIGCLQVV